MSITVPLSGEFRLMEPNSEDYVILPNPKYGYKTTINLPFEIQKLDNGDIFVRDEGQAYDKRFCVIDLFLTPTQAYDLKKALYLTAADRAKVIDIYLPGGGFFPFGPDKGDEGTFNVVAEIEKTEEFGYAPFRYFSTQLKITNVGQCPTYSLQAEIDDGNFIFGSTHSIRLPEALFVPEAEYQIDTQFTENNTPKFFDRGIGGYSVDANFSLMTNESKAASILNNLTNVVRTAQFSVTPPDPSYMFAVDNNSTGSYTVKLNQNSIVVTHNDYNKFSFPIKLKKVI